MLQGDDFHLQLRQEPFLHQVSGGCRFHHRTKESLQHQFMNLFSVQGTSKPVPPLGVRTLLHDPLKGLTLVLVTFVTNNTIKLTEPLLIQSIH